MAYNGQLKKDHYCRDCFFYPHDNDGSYPCAGKCRITGRFMFEYRGERCRHFSEWTIEKQLTTYL